MYVQEKSTLDSGNDLIKLIHLTVQMNHVALCILTYKQFSNKSQQTLLVSGIHYTFRYLCLWSLFPSLD